MKIKLRDTHANSWRRRGWIHSSWKLKSMPDKWYCRGEPSAWHRQGHPNRWHNPTGESWRVNHSKSSLHCSHRGNSCSCQKTGWWGFTEIEQGVRVGGGESGESQYYDGGTTREIYWNKLELLEKSQKRLEQTKAYHRKTSENRRQGENLKSIQRIAQIHTLTYTYDTNNNENDV